MRSAKCIRWQTKKALRIEVPCIWEYRCFLQGIPFGFCHVLKDFAQGRIAISALVPWTIGTGNQQRTPEFGVSNSLGSGGRLLDWESTTQATTLTFFRFINSVSKLCFFGRGGVHLKSKREGEKCGVWEMFSDWTLPGTSEGSTFYGFAHTLRLTTNSND